MAHNSEHERMRGNVHYKSALCEDDMQARRDGLQMAFNCYSNALQYASSSDARSSAAKNLATAAWKLAQTVGGMGDEPVQLHQYYLREAVTNFDKALLQGQHGRSDSWLENLKESYYCCAQDYIDSMIGLQMMKRISEVEKLALTSKWDIFKSQCYLEIGKVLFHASVSPLQDGDYKKALHHLAEAHRPMEEARRLCQGHDVIVVELRILEDEVIMHKSAAESLQARKIGEDLQEETIKGQETLNMDMLYDVIDWYKKSILLSRELEIEMEAISLSRLGQVYDRILMMEVKAKEYFLRSVQLALSLEPRKFDTEDWFKTCKLALDRYQRKVRQDDDETKQKARQGYIKELAAELKQLDEHKDDEAIAFLMFVYDTFKPKKQEDTLDKEKIKTLEAMEEGNMKKKTGVQKLLQKAVVHYHPDKQAKHGQKHAVLCEEITKRLTARYEFYKGMDDDGDDAEQSGSTAR